MKKGFIKSALIVSATLVCSSVWAAQGDLIVKFKKGVQSQNVLRSFGPMQVEPVVKDLGIVLLKSKTAVLSMRSVMAELKSNPNVVWVQEDHIVTMRETVPNDEMFANQWALQSGTAGGINATMAWDVGQGGKNINGHDVVVAVVDQGVDVNHTNLADNIWVNAREIADNNIDDDNNGYVDDIHGWDGTTNTGNVSPGRHGTHVAGIIGAVGNDRTQTAGVNWHTKIMTVKALGGYGNLTSKVLASYGYILKQKQLFLETNGVQGANVVATNSSFGVDYGKCETGDYPAWNDMYNQMGEVGILSAAATINGGVNVDTAGDVPTGCSSDYIVSVTNTTVEGVKYASAGYGATTIDIGAPGTKILSTVLQNGTQELTGTSMATPHVAGAIGFLYSIANKDFNELVRQSPGEAALEIKRILMVSVTAQEDLAGKIVSEGRLNLDAASKAMLAFKR